MRWFLGAMLGGLVACGTLLGYEPLTFDRDAGTGPAAVTDADARTDGADGAEGAPEATPCVRPSHPPCDGPCEPVVLASGIRDSNALVAEQSPCGAGHIVWMTFGCLPDGGAGEVTSARKDGSDRRQIGTSACLHDLTGGDSYVAWATAETVHAARWDGADMHLVSSVGDSYRVAAVGDTVYWGSTQDSTIGKHSLVGPACDPNCKFTDARERVLSMGANHGPVFYGTQDGGAVWRLLDDGGSQLVADGLAYPGHIAPDGDRVFWISDGRIYRADLDAGTAAPFVTENAWALAVHGGALFWTVENEVHSLDLDGGQLKTIARNQAAPHAIAADDVAVYWLNYGTTPEGADGQLMKLDRD